MNIVLLQHTVTTKEIAELAEILSLLTHYLLMFYTIKNY